MNIDNRLIRDTVDEMKKLMAIHDLLMSDDVNDDVNDDESDDNNS